MIKSFQQFINESLRRATVADDKRLYTCLYELINKAILDPEYIDEFRSSFENTRRNVASYLFEIATEISNTDTYTGLNNTQFTPIDENTTVSVNTSSSYDGNYEWVTRVNVILRNNVDISFVLINYASEYDEPAEEAGDTYVEIDLSKAARNVDLDETIDLLKDLSAKAFEFVK